MAWEKHRKKDFYYRYRRAGNQVHKVYLGGGEIARQAAAKDAAVKAKRAADKAEPAELEMKLSSVDQLANDVQHGVAILAEAALLVLGYHEHRGEWRLKNVDRA